jgi:hypothetical protein
MRQLLEINNVLSYDSLPDYVKTDYRRLNDRRIELETSSTVGPKFSLRAYPSEKLELAGAKNSKE